MSSSGKRKRNDKKPVSGRMRKRTRSDVEDSNAATPTSSTQDGVVNVKQEGDGDVSIKLENDDDAQVEVQNEGTIQKGKKPNNSRPQSVKAMFGSMAVRHPFLKVLDDHLFKTLEDRYKHSMFCSTCTVRLQFENVKCVMGSRGVSTHGGPASIPISGNLRKKSRFLKALYDLVEIFPENSLYRSYLQHIQSEYRNAVIPMTLNDVAHGDPLISVYQPSLGVSQNPCRPHTVVTKIEELNRRIRDLEATVARLVNGTRDNEKDQEAPDDHQASEEQLENESATHGQDQEPETVPVRIKVESESDDGTRASGASEGSKSMEESVESKGRKGNEEDEESSELSEDSDESTDSEDDDRDFDAMLRVGPYTMLGT